MRPYIIIIIIVLFCYSPITAQNKFGYVNASKIIESMPEYERAKQEVNNLQKQYVTDLNMMQEELKKKKIEFDSLPAETPQNIKQLKEKEISDMENKYNQTYQDYQTQLQNKAAENMQNISKMVIDAANIVGREGGFVYIIDTSDKQFLYYSKTLATDVTNQVKDKLNMIKK